jgi:hypothetical protein
MNGVVEAMGTTGALGTLMLGLFGLVAPRRAARMVGLVPDGIRGISELRATYGGLFAAMGLACLLLQDPAAYGVAACAWLGAATARLVSLVVDRNVSWLNVGGVALEALLGALLWTGTW